MRNQFSLSLILEMLILILGDANFFMIYCHSPGGDAAVALSDRELCTTYIQSSQGDGACAMALVAFVLYECSCCL